MDRRSDLLIRIVAVALMLTGAVLLIAADSASALPFALVAIGIALTVFDWRQRIRERL
jgi:hypothetical protein